MTSTHPINTHDEEILNDSSRFPSLEICGMMGTDEVLARLKMKARIKKARMKHNHKIYHSEQCGWFTDVDDPTRPNKRRKLRKCSEEKLLFALAEWYEKNDLENCTLWTIFPKWLELKEAQVKD